MVADGIVEVKGVRELRIKLDRVAESVASNKRLMGEIGNFVELQILTRTADGIGADDEPFEAYSVGYERRRSAEGRPTDAVDLFFTGSMLSALTHDADNDRVTLFFMDTSDKFGMRNPEKAYYNQQLRNFFALSAKDVADVTNMVSDYVAKALKKG